MTARADVKECTKNFWRYASQLKGTADIEDVFVDWAAQNSQEVSLNDIQDLWTNINQDIFDIRVALNADAFQMILDKVMEGTATPEEEKVIEQVESTQEGLNLPSAMKPSGNELKPANTPAATVETKPKQETAIPEQKDVAPTQQTTEEPTGEKQEKNLLESLIETSM